MNLFHIYIYIYIICRFGDFFCFCCLYNISQSNIRNEETNSSIDYQSTISTSSTDTLNQTLLIVLDDDDNDINDNDYDENEHIILTTIDKNSHQNLVKNEEEYTVNSHKDLSRGKC